MRLAASLLSIALLTTTVTTRAQDQQDATYLSAIASRWTVRFERGLSGLLFRERYRQQVDRPTVTTLQRAVYLEANVFLLRPGEADTFVLFRDVYSRDGQPLGDHTARLEALLADGSGDAITQARALTDASARFNVGPVSRNVNIPTMALAYLEPERIAGVRFTRAGDERINGVDTVIVDFEETARPTYVRGSDDAEVPARGRYWVDPKSGAVVRAKVEFAGSDMTGSMVVDMVLHPELSVWVPKSMNETWRTRGRRATGMAEYDRFQRLAVSTEEIVKIEI